MKQSCNILSTVTGNALRNDLWRIYQQSFQKAGQEAAQLQSCYTEEEFMAALADEQYAKVIVTEGDVPVGFALLTNNLAKAEVTYVNSQRLRNAFPTESSEGRVWYCTAMVVTPSAQGHGHANQIIREVALFLKARRSVVAYDHSECNKGLSTMIAHVFGRVMREEDEAVRNPTHAILGSQTYATMDCFAR